MINVSPSCNPVDANHKKVSLRLLLVGVTSGISATPTSIRMCPPLTTKNWPYYTPVVAIGTCHFLCHHFYVDNMVHFTVIKEFRPVYLS